MSQDFLVEIEASSIPETKIVHLKGELDELNVITLDEKIKSLLNDPSAKKMVFDFGSLDFINSKGVGYLVSVHTHMAKDGRVLVLAAANEAVMDVISLVGLTSILPYFATLQEALNG